MNAVNLYLVRIRRDAHTTIVETVTGHELAVLQAIFGIENVHNKSGKRIDQEGLDSPVSTRKIDSVEEEYERISMKYGSAVIERIYGIPTNNTLGSKIEYITAESDNPEPEPEEEEVEMALEEMTRDELYKLAQDAGFEVTTKTKKDDLIALLRGE